MASLFFLRATRRPHWSILVFLLGLTGCESDARRATADRDSATQTRAAAPDLRGEGIFLAGQLTADVVLDHKPAIPRAGSGSRESADGGRDRGETRRGGRLASAGDTGYMTNRENSVGPSTNRRASHEPPVSLRLRLTNAGSAPLEVEVMDFKSELGNFVVRPSKITVPSGESVDADPMVSELGILATDIPLVIRLRAGGQVESQTLMLRPIPPPLAQSPVVPARTLSTP